MYIRSVEGKLVPRLMQKKNNNNSDVSCVDGVDLTNAITPRCLTRNISCPNLFWRWLIFDIIAIQLGMWKHDSYEKKRKMSFM